MAKLIRICTLCAVTSMLLGFGLACNTTEGLGKDIKKGGENLEDSAAKNK